MVIVLTLLSLLCIAAYTAAVCIKFGAAPASISATFYKLERDIEQMKAAQASLTNEENRETTFTNPHQLEDNNNDTSDETLPQ